MMDHLTTIWLVTVLTPNALPFPTTGVFETSKCNLKTKQRRDGCKSKENAGKFVRGGVGGIAGKSDVSNAYRWDAVVSVIAQIESRIFFAMFIWLLREKCSSYLILPTCSWFS